MKRHNLFATLVLALALGGCAVLVNFGEADIEPLNWLPFGDAEAAGAP
jgi:hypothetical protein